MCFSNKGLRDIAGAFFAHLSEWAGINSGDAVRSLDCDGLLQLASDRIKNQDFIVGSDHSIPPVALGKGGGFCSIGQGDALGHGRPIAIETGDKQANDHYKPANHYHCQHGNQLTQKPQAGRKFRFRDVLLRSVWHGHDPF